MKRLTLSFPQSPDGRARSFSHHDSAEPARPRADALVKPFALTLLFAGLVTAAGCDPDAIEGAHPGPGGGNVAAVRFQQSDLFVNVGGSVQAVAIVTDKDGGVVSNLTLAWKSLDPQIAVISPLGMVEGRAVGTARITVAYGSLEDTARVHVGNGQAGGASITPANLMAVLGPLIPRNGQGTEPIKTYDQRFQTTELARYNDYIGDIGNPARDQLGLRIDANHYGALRGRLAWSLRNGLPLDEDTSTPYGRGVRIVRDYLQVVAKPNKFGVQAHRGSGLPDIEALYVLEGDADALTYIHVQAMKYTYDQDGTLKFAQSWSDARQNAVGLEALSAAHRLGIPFTRNSANTDVGFDSSPGSWKAAGERLIQWIEQYVVKPNGAIPSPAHQGAEAYLFNAMLAMELLKWHGHVAPNATAFNLARRIVDHLIDAVPPGWETLPYRESEPWPAPDLAAFYVWPSLVLWQETNDPKYRTFALQQIEASHDAYIQPLKQWNQTFSTGAMGAEALLDGRSWH